MLYIPDYTFCGMTSLRYVHMPDSVVSIGWSAFADCTSLATVVLPEYVSIIGPQAFARCTSLNFVFLPESCIDIGADIFSELTTVVAFAVKDSYAAQYLQQSKFKGVIFILERGERMDEDFYFESG
jgi:hypothetical protein